MRRMSATLALLCLIAFTLFGASEITFSGGSTRMSMQEGRQTITLSTGARITSGTVELTADQITLRGTDFRYVDCIGSVTLTDTERGITLISQSLFYDREEESIYIEGYLELDDGVNEVHASAFLLDFALEQGEVLLQAEVRLYKHTSSGVMACKADVLRFDRSKRQLELNGSATVDWDGDKYEAQRITVDLDTEEIAMDGSIKGVING